MRILSVLLVCVLVVSCWMVPIAHAEFVAAGLGIAAVVAAALSAVGVTTLMQVQSGGYQTYGDFVGYHLGNAVSSGVYGIKYGSLASLIQSWSSRINLKGNLMYLGGEIYEEMVAFKNYLVETLGLGSSAKEVYANNYLNTLGGQLELSSFAADQNKLSYLGDYRSFSGNDVGQRVVFFTLPDGTEVWSDVVTGTYANKVYIGDQVLIDESFSLTTGGFYYLWSWIVVGNYVFLVACSSTKENPDDVSETVGQGLIGSIYQCSLVGSEAILSGAMRVSGSVSASYDVQASVLNPGRGQSVALELPNVDEDELDVTGAVLSDVAAGTLSVTQSLVATETVPDNPLDPDNPANPDLPGYVAVGLKDVFPFCIPFDIYDFLATMDAQREAPVVSIPFDFGDAGSYTMVLDFTEFDTVAAVLRTMELLGFIIGLALITRKLINPGG